MEILLGLLYVFVGLLIVKLLSMRGFRHALVLLILVSLTFYLSPSCARWQNSTAAQRAANVESFSAEHPELDAVICTLDTAKHGPGNEILLECR